MSSWVLDKDSIGKDRGCRKLMYTERWGETFECLRHSVHGEENTMQGHYYNTEVVQETCAVGKDIVHAQRSLCLSALQQELGKTMYEFSSYVGLSTSNTLRC